MTTLERDEAPRSCCSVPSSVYARKCETNLAIDLNSDRSERANRTDVGPFGYP